VGIREGGLGRPGRKEGGWGGGHKRGSAGQGSRREGGRMGIREGGLSRGPGKRAL
jgi:hypothetical protein